MIGLAIAACLAAAPFAPERSVDFSAAAFLAAPERFALCVAMHPARVVEIDLCSGLDRGVTALASHVFVRKPWARALGAQPGRGLTVALGAGAGARISRFCPFDACAVQVGPEVLASIEAVLWLWPGFGVTAQLDAGVAVVWGEVLPGLFEPTLRVPARLLLGVAL